MWSFDCEKQEWVLSEVEATSVREYTGDIITIEIEAADGTLEIIQATGNHPFWVEAGENLHERPASEELPEDEPKPSDRGRWVDANDLETRDTFISRTRVSARIIALRRSQDSLRVYNLTVRLANNFAVGTRAILVHNHPCPKDFASDSSLRDHFNKHSAEWGDSPMTIAEYLGRARTLLATPIGGDILGHIRKNGDILRYNRATNEFAVMAPDGTIRTLFRPTRGIEYWEEQIAK